MGLSKRFDDVGNEPAIRRNSYEIGFDSNGI